MTTLEARLALLWSLSLLGACGTELPTLEAHAAGYRHPTYGYVFSYRDAGRQLLSPAWAPHVAVTERREVPLDPDGDGVADDVLEVPVYDLVYTDRATAGAMFVSTFPTSREASASDLGDILAGYVTAAGRAGRVVHGFPRGVSRSLSPMATRVLGSRPRVVDGRAAHEVLFEIAAAPAPHVTDTTAWTRAHVVLVRPDLVFSDQQYSRARGSSTDGFYPVLFVMGYANRPGDFAAGHAEFEDLISRLRFEREPEVEALGPRLGACVASETLVEFLVLPEGRVGAHAALPDGAAERCVSQTLITARLPASDWPRTFALRVAPPTP